MSATVALIVAAGRGERFGAAGPKQYVELAGKSVLQRSCEAFCRHPQIDAVLTVIHRDDDALYAQSVTPHEKLLPPTIGGATRQQSVRLGLEALAHRGFDTVLIHDAARPLISAKDISACIAATGPQSGTILARPVADTLKRAGNGMRISGTVDRKDVYRAETPQCFPLAAILAAHRAAASRDDLTDDAAVAELAGLPVQLVPASSGNLKITTAIDLDEARLHLAAAMLPDVRSATGYDVHALVPGDHVTLCGIAIPHTMALSGHSDADVGLHALTDALLGTIGDGDIGSHFPPSDPQWRGAASSIFLAHAASLVRKAGGTITLVDVSLICEAPKIGPHRQAMREAIAAAAGVSVSRVAVKATTNEKIGFIGRGEGIAAIATATVVFPPMMPG